MTHDEADALKFPAKCWTYGHHDKGEPFAMPVTVTGYRMEGGWVKVLVCKSAKQPRGYQCSVDMVYLTREACEAQITLDLKETVLNYWDNIKTMHEEIAATIKHPLWKN